MRFFISLSICQQIFSLLEGKIECDGESVIQFFFIFIRVEPKLFYKTVFFKKFNKK